jgi:hypothetical protein
MKRLTPRAALKAGRQSLRTLRGAADLRPAGPTTPATPAAQRPTLKPRSGVVRRRSGPTT